MAFDDIFTGKCTFAMVAFEGLFVSVWVRSQHKKAAKIPRVLGMLVGMLAGTLVPGEVLGACEGPSAVRTSKLGSRLVPPSAAGKHSRGRIRAVAPKDQDLFSRKPLEGQRSHGSWLIAPATLFSSCRAWSFSRLEVNHNIPAG